MPLTPAQPAQPIQPAQSAQAADLAPDLATDPQAVLVVKRPDPVAVEFARQAGLLQTREGPVHYQAGDALLTGPAGERWPVQRERFDATYAAQADTQAGADGHYAKRHQVVWARCMDTAFSVRVGPAQDRLQGQAGDWLLQYAPGEYGVVAADLFKLTYALLGTDSRD